MVSRGVGVAIGRPCRGTINVSHLQWAPIWAPKCVVYRKGHGVNVWVGLCWWKNAVGLEVYPVCLRKYAKKMRRPAKTKIGDYKQGYRVISLSIKWQVGGRSPPDQVFGWERTCKAINSRKFLPRKTTRGEYQEEVVNSCSSNGGRGSNPWGTLLKYVNP